MENVLSSPETPTGTVSAPKVDVSPRPKVSEAAARRAFSTSMMVSATRCLLTYIVLPFVAPLIGIAGDVGPGVGIAISLVAITSNILTIRRFHAAQHKWRWAYTGIAVCVIIGLLILMGQDVADLIG